MFHVAMARGQDINIIEIVIHGGVVAKSVLAVLGMFSAMNWIIIFQKTIALGRRRRVTKKFRKAFNQAADSRAKPDAMSN